MMNINWQGLVTVSKGLCEIIINELSFILISSLYDSNYKGSLLEFHKTIKGSFFKLLSLKYLGKKP